MTTIQTRNSVLAVKVESTEGVPVVPTGASDFIAIQDDFDMSQEFESLENAELKASIGMAKPISGLETGSVSFSHYMRHSGVEGTAPNYSNLLKSLFGNQVAASTEYDTIAGSTTILVKVNTGEGVNFQRGQALLIKDATNGYSIRPVHSVSGDNLTLGFALAVAPGTGVNLGKAVTFLPTNSGHQTLTLFYYAGNGGALKAVSGVRITEASIEISAGELINASYSGEGIKNYFNPINILSTDQYLDFTDDDGTYAVTVTAQLWQDPHQLAEALTSAMNASGTTETHSVTYSDSTGKFTIANTTGALLSLLWSTGTNTANTIGDKIGFTVSADDTGALTYTSDSAISFAAPYTPSYDTADALVAKSNLCMVGDSDDYACFAAQDVSVTIGNEKTDIMSICSSSGRAGSLVSAREVTINITAYLNQYDADKFKRMRTNADTRFAYIFGQKSGDNWVAGKCGCIYAPTCVVTSLETPDADGLVGLEMELKGYVDSSGNGEIYISLV
jgi:hypothetical protein